MAPIYLSVVIPAYNEEKRLPATLESVITYLKNKDYRSEIIVVDDGSKDGTSLVVNRIGAQKEWQASETRGVQSVTAVKYPEGGNHGKGYAVRFGMVQSTGKYRVFMDADNSTTVDHVERFLPYIKEDNYDIVIGSRDVRDADVAVHQAWYKEAAGNLGNLLIRIMAVRGIYDTQAGFKMFTDKSVKEIFPLLTIDRWGFDIEILAVAQRLGFKIKEAPITWINDPNSKVSAKAYLEVLGEVFKIRRNIWQGKYDVAKKYII